MVKVDCKKVKITTDNKVCSYFPWVCEIFHEKKKYQRFEKRKVLSEVRRKNEREGRFSCQSLFAVNRVWLTKVTP